MSDQKPQFSIIIATGARADLARMAVQSVLKQTCQDFEIILGDWADTDESRALAKLDQRIRYLLTTSDTPYGGWNVSVREARGSYVLWLDDDNYLLPYALELFHGSIQETHADVVTATHLYYYDREHPRVHLRNSLGIIPFSGTKRQISLKQVLRDQFAFTRSSSQIRLHTSATAVSSRVIRKSFDTLGFIILDYLPNIHSMFPILMSFAETCTFIDHPTVIVGRYGNSLSQNWAMQANERFKKQPFPIRLSPVQGWTRINSTLENYLNVKQLLAGFYGDIPIGYEQFVKIYMQELAYLDTDLGNGIRNWANLFAFLKTFPRETRSALRKKVIRFAALAPVVYLSRRLRLYPTWRNALGHAILKRERRINAAEKFSKKREFSIPLTGGYPVASMESLAAHVRDILIAETGRDIFAFPR